MLQLKDIKKHYELAENKVEALKGVTFNFRKSEFVSILGPSGCGKTTLLNIIGGLDRYTDGDLIIDGVSTKEYKDKDWDNYRNKTIGFVFQSYNLIMHQSVLKNVELALTLSGVNKTERRNRAIKALEDVGLKEQIFKKPTQLSGGQMQRVAIARALVNNPSVILADEPTGALDTETSRQIMDLMEEISKDRLIIMVTHNAELAKEYSTRIIKLLDGKVISDSNPYSDEELNKDFEALKKEEISEDEKQENEVKEKKKNKTSMSYLTALNLSFDNLKTKKARTILTSFAGSIGIIGIALVLAISSGFQSYINNMQEETLTSYPITISENTYDINQLLSVAQGEQTSGTDDEFVVNSIMSNMNKAVVSNNISQTYIDEVIEPLKAEDYVNDILIDYDLNLAIYNKRTINDQTKYVKGYFTYPEKLNSSGLLLGKYEPLWTQMLNNSELLLDQYELVGDSKLPTKYDEIAVVVDSNYRISDLTLVALGLQSDNLSKIKLDTLLNMELQLISNNGLYTYQDGRFRINIVNEDVYQAGTTLKITAVLKAKSETDVTSLMGGVYYHTDLINTVIESAKTSDIVVWQLANPTLNPLTGSAYIEEDLDTIEQQRLDMLASLNYLTSPSKIRIFAVDFEGKKKITDALDAYNEGKQDEDQVRYTDSMALVVNTMNTIVDVISYVLIAFISISLVVSSIMIGIITYISVLERTKEIGILRAIGARKKDISRVFNAETLIVGFTSGLLGVFITLILSVPINIVVSGLTGINNIANLSALSAIILIAISMLLTLIAGLIPAKVATKKDPVEALRQ